MNSAEFDFNPEAFNELVEEAGIPTVFPDAVMIVPGDLGRADNARLEKAGFGIAEVIFANGDSNFATFIVERTPVVQAIETIWEFEQLGHLPAGSHEHAMDSVRNNEFDLLWASYLPGHRN